MPETRQRLESIFRERIAVLDGSWGVLIQRELRGEEAYRGERFREHSHDVAGDPDLLNITRPEVVSRIHDDYFAAGADIATTNTFTATTIGQADYAFGADVVREMNLEGARLARRAADAWTAKTPDRPRFVAGAVGPLNVTLSLSPRVDDPSYRAVTFDEVRDAYAHQIAALRDGGVDILLVETVFDSLNAKAAIAAALAEAPELPLWLSFTAIDKSGRNLSGQTVEAFWLSVEHARPLIVGVNCSLGAAEMRPFVEDMAGIATTWVACYPNAGLPNEFGLHDEQPHDTSRMLGEFARDGLVNVVGGCCGTTPEHIREIAAAVEGVAPRALPEPEPVTRFSGLEPFAITEDTNFVMIGERTNITGSARFRRLVEAGEWQEALEVALEQVRGGANLLDVNMDADLLEGPRGDDDVPQPRRDRAGDRAAADHGRQLALVGDRGGAALPPGEGRRQLALAQGGRGGVSRRRRGSCAASAPASSSWRSTRRARRRRCERKVAICERAYRLLVDVVGFPPEDIIFDSNVLAVATGIEEHNGFAKAFIEALPLIKERCPGVEDERRHLESLVLVPRQQRRARGDALGVPLPRDPRGARHGHRQRRPARAVPGHRSRAPRARRGRHLRPARGRNRAARRDRRPREGGGHAARARPRVARGARRGAALARARARDRRLHRGRRRGGATPVRAAARRDRGAADGGHADRRRPLRRREDVPAAGREERARDEDAPLRISSRSWRRRRPAAACRGRSCSRP